ncbi:hypothetical protein [Nocardia sp. NPDC058480]|uniref:hypothetical protein n=1 Tax=Nocardia sp. NPDC058480 TaxID=3346522 RepID=UPI003650C811
MMRLKNSRGLFFDRTKEPRISYWANPKLVDYVKAAGGRAIPKYLTEWDPCAEDSRSNCPHLHDMLVNIVEMVHPKWRDRARNIFAGRTFSDIDTATANRNLRGGMISMSENFTQVIYAYASMQGTFIYSVDLGKNMTDSEVEAMWQGMRSDFDEAIALYRAGGLLAMKGSLPMVSPSEEFRRAAESLASAAESWILAHELGHHLARDMSSRKDQDVVKVLREVTTNSLIAEKLRTMSEDQRCEVEADLLATLILCGHFVPEEHSKNLIETAIGGAGIALVSVAHFRDEWTADPSDSHPGCLERLWIIAVVMSELYGTIGVDENDPARAHITVFRLAALIMTFGSWVHNVETMLQAADVTRQQTGRRYPVAAVTFAKYAAWFGILAEDAESLREG